MDTRYEGVKNGRPGNDKVGIIRYAGAGNADIPDFNTINQS
jgi:hypothetical protein